MKQYGMFYLFTKKKILIFILLRKKAFENIVGKGEKTVVLDNPWTEIQQEKIE